MKVDLLLKNAGVIDETGSFFKGKNLIINKGDIISVSAELQKEYEPADELDASHLVITPGLVNLHTHSPMTLFRGIAEDVSIDDWFNKEIWPYEKNMSETHAYVGALAAIYEMLDNGVTAFADHYMFPESIISAVMESGIRCDLAPTLFGLSDSFQADVAHSVELIKKYQHTHEGLSLRFGLHSPYTCSYEQIKQVVDLAKELGVGIHLHVSETRKQVEDSLKRLGKTPFQVIAEAGGFQVPAIVAHGLWVTPEDRQLLTPSTHFAVSPKTYMKLAMGSGHIWDYPEALPLAIGTDGAASSNTLNPVEQAATYGLMGKLLKEDATRYPLKMLWQMIMKGHDALPFKTGRIQPGYKADLAFWDMNHPSTIPHHNPLASILYSSTREQIKHVMIGGCWVKYEGKVAMNMNSIQKQLFEATKDLLSKGKGNSSIKF